MPSKSFEYAKDITVAALQGSSKPFSWTHPEEIVMKFFEHVYEKLKEIEKRDSGEH